MNIKNVLKKAITLIMATTMILSSTACNRDKHDHVWQNYMVANPSCTKTGLLEKICTACGQKVYEEIQANGHTYEDGKCRVCGLPGFSEDTLVRIPTSDESIPSNAWSFRKIYDIALSVGYTKSYSNFINILSNGWMQDIYLDQLGLLHTLTTYDATYGDGLEWVEIPLAVIVFFKSFTCDLKSSIVF